MRLFTRPASSNQTLNIMSEARRAVRDMTWVYLSDLSHLPLCRLHPQPYSLSTEHTVLLLWPPESI